MATFLYVNRDVVQLFDSKALLIHVKHLFINSFPKHNYSIHFHTAQSTHIYVLIALYVRISLIFSKISLLLGNIVFSHHNFIVLSSQKIYNKPYTTTKRKKKIALNKQQKTVKLNEMNKKHQTLSYSVSHSSKLCEKIKFEKAKSTFGFIWRACCFCVFLFFFSVWRFICLFAHFVSWRWLALVGVHENLILKR